MQSHHWFGLAVWSSNVASSKRLHLVVDNNNNVLRVLPPLSVEGQHFDVLRFAVVLSLCSEGQHQCLLLSVHLSVPKDNNDAYRFLSISLFHKTTSTFTVLFCLSLFWRTSTGFTVFCPSAILQSSRTEQQKTANRREYRCLTFCRCVATFLSTTSKLKKSRNYGNTKLIPE